MTDAQSSSPPGILPCQSIDDLIASGAITSAKPFDADQVQPASLDLRLGARAWRVRASFLPGLGRTVPQRIDDVAMHELDLTKGAVLERGKYALRYCRMSSIIHVATVRGHHRGVVEDVRIDHAHVGCIHAGG